MISLRQKLYESLLDDEEELATNNDIFREIFKDPEFRSMYAIKETFNILSTKFSNDLAELSGTTGDLEIQDETLLYKGDIMEIGNGKKNIKPLNDFIPFADTIKAEANMEIRNPIVSNKTICDNLIAANIYIASNTVENINMSVKGKKYYFSTHADHKVTLEAADYKRDLNFKNINIDMDGYSDLCVAGKYTKDLSGIKSNNEYLFISCSGMFEDKEYLNAFNSLLDTSYTYLTGKQREFERKGDVKNILATIHNRKKYVIHSPLFKLKPNAKLSDIINVKNMKDLKIITFTDFYKPNKLLKCIKFYKSEEFIENYILLDRYVKKYSTTVLADGWIMRIIGNK